MRTFILACLFSLLAASVGLAADPSATVFPPSDCSNDEQRVMTWQTGGTSTKCATGQHVMNLALPSCSSGQIVVKQGNEFACVTPPSCPTNAFLNFVEGVFICSPIVLPKCANDEFLSSHDGSTFICAKEGKACTPNWTTTGYGACSKNCGGGVQDVHQSDGCGNTRALSQACNTQACTTCYNARNGVCCNFDRGDCVSAHYNIPPGESHCALGFEYLCANLNGW